MGQQYIENLTGYLFSKNRYDAVFERFDEQGEFLSFVKTDLSVGDVRDMNASTLGKIMCSFEIGDVMANRTDLFAGVTFSGDCEEFLRELVSLCLAYSIYDRVSLVTQKSINQ